MTSVLALKKGTVLLAFFSSFTLFFPRRTQHARNPLFDLIDCCRGILLTCCLLRRSVCSVQRWARLSKLFILVGVIVAVIVLANFDVLESIRQVSCKIPDFQHMTFDCDVVSNGFSLSVTVLCFF